MIKIQNIYHMLSYAFKVLRADGYSKCATEEFENTADILSAILLKGIEIQIKRGFQREYIEITEPLSGLRGKIDVTESIKTQSIIRHQMVCIYDDFSVNSYVNQIIKTTLQLLLRHNIPALRKKELRNMLLYFKDIDTLDLYKINWKVNFNRNNQSYQMMINVCWLIIKGLLQTDNNGNMKLQKFLDEQRMCKLYEKFILEYFKKEFPRLKVSSSRIPWNLDDEDNDILPVMQSDIMLSFKEKILIIDAKYYSRTLQTNYDKNTIHSSNLYQIFTYVKNRDIENTGNVSGMLLYARTHESMLPDKKYQMSGNTIRVKTLDLGCDFSEIANQLDSIAISCFGNPVID